MPTAWRTRSMPGMPSVLARASLLVPLSLALAAPASAADLRVPLPAAGGASVGVAKVSKAGKVTVSGRLPAGAVVTGGVSRGRLAVAVVRPASAKGKGGTVRVRVRGARLSGATTSSSVLTDGPSVPLAAAIKPACAAVPARALRGKGAAVAAGRVVLRRACGVEPDQVAQATLKAAGLTFTPPAPPKPPVAAPAAPPVAAAAVVPPPAPPAPAPPAPPASRDGVKDACQNGIDDDGDGQVDALSRGAQFFDPGCATLTDTTEGSEKATPKACGFGVATHGGHRYAINAEWDSIGRSDCPQNMRDGVVDLAVPIDECNRAEAMGVRHLGGCGLSGGNVKWSYDPVNQWGVEALATKDVCGAKTVMVAYDDKGQAWESHGTVFDGLGVCAKPDTGRPAECADGVDNDSDSQVDMGDRGGFGLDPGCTSPADDDEAAEGPFGSWGCFGLLARDASAPGTVDFHLMSWRGACPTVDKVWVSLDDEAIKACPVALIDGKAATCTLKEGDITITGASGTSFAARLQADAKTGCDEVFVDGQVDVLVGTTMHEAVLAPGFYDEDGRATLCP